jgi:hypothetical protein
LRIAQVLSKAKLNKEKKLVLLCDICTVVFVCFLSSLLCANKNLKLNHDQNLKPNQKQNSHEHVLRKESVSCNPCQLTKGIGRESLCPIQTLPKCIQIKVQNRTFSFLKYLEIFQEFSDLTGAKPSCQKRLF